MVVLVHFEVESVILDHFRVKIGHFRSFLAISVKFLQNHSVPLKTERKNKLWPVKEKNEVFMKYVEAFLKNMSPELITTAAAPTMASEEPTSSVNSEDDKEESEKRRKRSAGDKFDELISTEGLKN